MDSFAFVESTHRETLAVIESVSDDEFNASPGPGRWSVAQVLEHIWKTDMSIIPVFRRAAKDRRPYTGSPKGVERAADRTVKIEAPEFIRPSDEPKSRDALRQALEEARRTLMEAARAVGDPEELERLGAPVPHPVFGELSLREWLEFVGYHERRHVAQARETLEDVRRA
ncbi:DinB family protein [Alicyclobacillus sendaiensis]|uniref:DinB family protein n=1 Tax=Alicyclobacillus sendaiensis PA2 TaxID=3029425 RepID=A0ABT6XX17_ALISE|nr:DinB family protein [Alicyclobacillus sendaiensis]MDI9259608.1 DinB family protein [Alicyclobacillus sendaiensis PA2]